MIAESLAKMSVRPFVRSCPKATEKRAVLCVTYYLGYLLEEVQQRSCRVKPEQEVNSKPISNSPPLVAFSNPMHHDETRRASNRRTTENEEKKPWHYL